MTQDNRLFTMRERLRTATSNIKFARALGEGARILRADEAEEFNALVIEAVRELGAFCKEMRLGEASTYEDE